MESTSIKTGRTDENAGSVKPFPVQMKVFWTAVVELVNQKLNANYSYRYFAEVYRGDRDNAGVRSVMDECVQTVLKKLENGGFRPRYPLERRP